MKKLLGVILFMAHAFWGHAQITFELGYFIGNDNIKKECLIKNIDWKNNPSEFEYKFSDNDEEKIATINEVKEFAVDGGGKYQRFVVDIERSQSVISTIDYNYQPEFNREQLFLKILVEGKASLYEFTDPDITKFFYKKDTMAVEQLIKKTYKVSETKLSTNEKFKQQLWVNFNCEGFSRNDFERLDYTRKALTKIFVRYNRCEGSDYVNHKEEENQQDFFNLSIRPGVTISSLSIENSLLKNSQTVFATTPEFRFGLETEFVMNFNKNKWSIIFEPAYQQFQSNEESGEKDIHVDYKSLELLLGLRHYFFLNPVNKIFINVAYVQDFAFDSKILDYERGITLDMKSRSNFAFGAGFNYNSKFSIEGRYSIAREVLSDFIMWNSNYSGVSLILGYSLF